VLCKCSFIINDNAIHVTPIIYLVTYEGITVYFCAYFNVLFYYMHILNFNAMQCYVEPANIASTTTKFQKKFEIGDGISPPVSYPIPDSTLSALLHFMHCLLAAPLSSNTWFCPLLPCNIFSGYAITHAM